MAIGRRLFNLVEQGARSTPLFLHYDQMHQETLRKTCRSKYLWVPLGAAIDSMRIFDELLSQLSPDQSVRFAHNTQSSIASLRLRFKEMNVRHNRPVVVVDNFHRFNPRDSSRMIAYLLETADIASTIFSSHLPLRKFNPDLLEDKRFKMFLELVPERKKL